MSNKTDNLKLKSNFITIAERSIQGSLFVAQVRETLASAASVDVGVMVPTGFEIVLGAFEISSTSGDFSLEIFEGSTFTSGTAIFLFNPNRVVGTTPSSTSVLNPTVTDDGTLIGLLETIGDNAGKSVGGLTNEVPITLKANTDYIFRITHNAANSKDFIIYFTGSAQKEEGS